MEANNYPLIRRSVAQRGSIRSSKRLMRSSSGISPLARNLLRSLHEQKRAALAEKRARRWELYSVVNQPLMAEPESSSITGTNEEDQIVPSLVPVVIRDETTKTFDDPSLYADSGRYETQSKSSKKKGLIRFRAVKKHVSQAVTRMFLRKSDKHQVAESSGADQMNLKSFRRYPSTVL